MPASSRRRALSSERDSGEAEALEEAMAAFQEAKVKARKLVVSHAFHSHLMDPMLEEFAAGDLDALRRLDA